jgi:hypothetical protein
VADDPNEKIMRRMESLGKLARESNAGTVYVIERDRAETIIRVTVYAEGEDARALAQWLEDQDT